jgi:Cu/Ag efflux pump CusA
MRDVGALLDGQNKTVGNGLNVLTGLDTPLAVRLYGQDPKVLAVEAPKVRDLMASVDGVVDPRVLLPPTQPSIEIEVDLAKAQAFGVTPGDVRRAEATLLQGIQVGSVFEQQKVFDVIVQGVPSTRADVESIRNLLMDRPGGGYLRLGDVADVRIVDTPTVIQREAVSRRLDIVAGVTGSGTAAVAAALERQLSDLKLPLGYHAEVVQDSTQQEIGAGRMLFYGIGALIAVFLLLQAAFRSWRLAGLVLATLPLSLVGGLVVVLLTGGELTIGALIGLLAVLGLAVRHALLWPAVKVDLVSRLLEGEARSLEKHRTAAEVGAGVRERFSSTMITTVALALLMLPFAILGPRPGLEFLHPMALVVLGALVTSSIVTLFVVPAIFLHFPPRSRVDHDLEDALNEREAAGRPSPGADRELTPGSAHGGANGHTGNGHLVGAQIYHDRAGQPHGDNGQSVGNGHTPRVPATLGAESDEPAK